ncbi:hypothetical protein AYO50_00410 [Acidobacteria bacterium SCGC AG-212-P17]|nr:hypothetical protein AYO50_00410 [Acidobacteria bacterium SCGC AG-212-P17]
MKRQIAALNPKPASLAVQKQPRSNPRPYSAHERFATFLAENDFKSTLLLENLRADVPMTFIPTLILRDGEIALDNVTVAAHSTATVDLSAFLATHGRSDQHGTVSIRYNFSTYGPGMAVVESVDNAHGIYLNSYAASAEEYWAGTTYDAVVWAPQEGTEGFIAFTNTSNEAHIVHTTFLVNGRDQEQASIQVPPRHTQFVQIHDLLDRSTRTGAGIHVEIEQGADEQYAGAILVEGQIFDKKNGFAKHIHFMDKALQFPTGTLRSHFLLLGNQPSEDGYPANILFHSVAAVRNVDTAPVKITPTVKFSRNGVVQSVSLPSLSLAASETALVDFSREQRAGRLPSDLQQGSIELTPDTGRVSIVSELFNFSDGGGYVVGPSFTSYPSRSTASIWRTDGTFQTSVVVENTAPQDDRVTLKLFSDNALYTKTFGIPAGGLLKINVKSLQQNAVLDDNGNTLSATSGVFHILGNRGTDSKLSYEKIIHSVDEGDYVGLPPNQCDYVEGVDLVMDTSSGVSPFPMWLDYYWAFSGDQFVPTSQTISSNSSLTQISNDGSQDWVTLTAPDSQSYSVTLSSPLTYVNAQSCDACSGGSFVVASFPFIFQIRHTHVVNIGTNMGDGFCPTHTSCTAGTFATCGVREIFVGKNGSCSPAWDCTNIVLDFRGSATCLLDTCFESSNSGPGFCN